MSADGPTMQRPAAQNWEEIPHVTQSMLLTVQLPRSEDEVLRKRNPSDDTITDFDTQWSRYTDNEGWYGSDELLEDILHPLLNADALAGQAILDIGSGTGRIVGMLLDAGAEHVYAIEPSEQAFQVLLRNIGKMERSEAVTAMHSTGEQFGLSRQVHVAVSIGVLHHIRDPLPVVRNAYAALKPGGHLFVWLYGYEGNEAYLRAISPIRRLTPKLPHALLRLFVEIGYWALVLYRAIDRVIRLPMHTYMEHVLWRLSPGKRRLVIYDQLNPAFSKYYKREEAIALLEEAGFRDVQAHHRHGYSWSVLGRKPSIAESNQSGGHCSNRPI